MTRINLTPPRLMATQHVFAEWREATRVPKCLWYALGRHGVEHILANAPPTFVLGTNHVRFFYVYGAWMFERFELLRMELSRRGINYNTTVVLDEYGAYSRDARLRQYYVPTPKALALSQQRLDERVAMRPNWYRFYA